MKFLTVLILATTLSACGARSSDEERVRELFANAEEAAEARDTSDVLAFVADEYTDTQGLDKKSLGNFLRAWFLAQPKVELTVVIESLEFPVDGLAQADITVGNLTASDVDLERLKVELRRDGKDWRVVRADRRR
jgi:hypothetical protein